MVPKCLVFYYEAVTRLKSINCKKAGGGEEGDLRRGWAGDFVDYSFCASNFFVFYYEAVNCLISINCEK